MLFVFVAAVVAARQLSTEVVTVRCCSDCPLLVWSTTDLHTSFLCCCLYCMLVVVLVVFAVGVVGVAGGVVVGFACLPVCLHLLAPACLCVHLFVSFFLSLLFVVLLHGMLFVL